MCFLKDKLDTMWNTVLNHGYGYGKLGGSLATTTYLVCKIDNVPKAITKENNYGTHAEKKLIEYLKKGDCKKRLLFIRTTPLVLLVLMN